MVVSLIVVVMLESSKVEELGEVQLAVFAVF